MAAGRYHPVNVMDGSRMQHDIYFNGCYLVTNINEHGVQVEVDRELPCSVAEFIYQKTLNRQWEGLGRAEKGENDVKNFEVVRCWKGAREAVPVVRYRARRGARGRI